MQQIEKELRLNQLKLIVIVATIIFALTKNILAIIKGMYYN